MQLPRSEADASEANAVQFIKPMPHTGNRNTTAAAHTSLPAATNKMDLEPIATPDVDQPPMPALDKAEPLAVVKQTINDLEEQGLLMLFDRQDQVAKQLMGKLIAAGVLQESIHLSESKEYSNC